MALPYAPWKRHKERHTVQMINTVKWSIKVTTDFCQEVL